MITVKAIRTNGIKKKEIDVTFDKVWSESLESWWLKIVDGNITGYESFEYSEKSILNMSIKGWLACMGTKGQWDTLEIEAEEMKKVFEYYKEKDKENE